MEFHCNGQRPCSWFFAEFMESFVWGWPRRAARIEQNSLRDAPAELWQVCRLHYFSMRLWQAERPTKVVHSFSQLSFLTLRWTEQNKRQHINCSCDEPSIASHFSFILPMLLSWRTQNKGLFCLPITFHDCRFEETNKMRTVHLPTARLVVFSSLFFSLFASEIYTPAAAGSGGTNIKECTGGHIC